MDRDFEQALTIMEGVVHQLADQVPPPRLVKHMGSVVFRYEEKSIRQAIVQKLARMVSYSPRCPLATSPRVRARSMCPPAGPRRTSR